MRSVTRSCVPVLVLATAVLSACGSANLGYGDPSGTGLATVNVSGDFGKTPAVTWSQVPATPSEAVVGTVIKGTGAAIPADRAVKANLYLSDVQADVQAGALCRAEAKPGVDCKSTNFPITAKVIPFSSANPIELPATDDPTSFVGKLRAGATLGTRVEALIPASTLAGLIPAAAQQAGVSVETYFKGLAIGNDDAVLMIVDFVKLGAATPKPVDVPASQLPSLTEKDGKPTGFNFAGIAAPKAGDTTLKRVVLTQGDGAVVTVASTVTANYLGTVYQGKKPFDESYSSAARQFPLSQVIQGWTYGLAGLKVGSRVLLEIPPSLGYGAEAKSGIPANSTLYFVVDIVAAQ